MTDTKIRIAIAEACGWICIRDSTEYEKGLLGFPSDYEGNLNAIGHLQSIPDYLNDLNAMHEAVSRLPSLTVFRGHLMGVYERDGGRANDFYMAAATQWAEAFLRTLNRWTE